MDQSPIEGWLQAIDARDVDAAMAPFADDARILTADGRRASGMAAIRELMAEFLGGLRSTNHRITAQWHEDNVWIAEVEATYELRDFLQLQSLPRAFFLRESDGAIADLRVYGAHERSLTDRPSGEGGMWVGERWIPPL
jgi:SnoaL-like domain